MKSLRTVSVYVIMGLVLAACASEPYKEPVATFAQAVTKSNEALAALDNQLAAAHTEVQRARVLSLQYRLELKNCGHAVKNSEQCLLLLQKTDEQGNDIGEPLSLQPEAPLTEVRNLLGGIETYADNLTAVLNADTTEKVRNSVTKALGSVERLAQDKRVQEKVSKQEAPTKDFSIPIAKVVNWVVGRYVESIKIDAIRHATHEADPIVHAATRVMIEAEGQGELVMDTTLVKTLRVRKDAWQVAPNEANLRNLIAAVEALQRFRRGTRRSLFESLARAHRSLTKRVADSGDLSWTMAMANVEQFKSEADTLLEIIDDLTALTKSSKIEPTS